MNSIKVLINIFIALHVPNVCSGIPNIACNADWCDPSHEPYPNIVSVMTGYHILKGNPFSSGTTHDPGFATSYIFVATQKDEQHRYGLVTGITARDVKKCALSLSTDTISTVEGFKEQIGNKVSEGTGFTSNLEVEVSAEIEGVGAKTTVPPIVDAAFSSSEEYRENSQFFTQKQGILTMNDATCSQYTMMIDDYVPPPFTDGFVAAVKHLQEISNSSNAVKQQEFNRFINHFGTHYVKKATMGARIAISRRYSRTEFEDSTDSAIKACNKNRLDFTLGFGVSHNEESCNAVSSTANSDEVQGFSREYVTTYGSAPAKDLYEWSKQEFTSPLPIKMKLSPILNLFTAAHMRRYDVSYETVLRWIAPFYETYCEDQQQSLEIPACHPKNQNGCGWDDNCVPRIEHCLSQESSPGYYCCTPKCRDLPCQNGGTCVDIRDSCSFTCNCRTPYTGKTCTDKYVDRGIIVGEIKRKMATHQSESNDDFRYTLRNYLTSDYPRYWFTVNSYGEALGASAHHAICTQCVEIYRQHGRNVVVAWSRKDTPAPSTATQRRILRETIAAITKKGRGADISVNLAADHVRKEGLPMTLIMVVRFGLSFRPTWTGGRTVFQNFICQRSCNWVNKCFNHESSLIMMFGVETEN